MISSDHSKGLTDSLRPIQDLLVAVVSLGFAAVAVMGRGYLIPVFYALFISIMFRPLLRTLQRRLCLGRAKVVDLPGSMLPIAGIFGNWGVSVRPPYNVSGCFLELGPYLSNDRERSPSCS